MINDRYADPVYHVQAKIPFSKENPGAKAVLLSGPVRQFFCYIRSNVLKVCVVLSILLTFMYFAYVLYCTAWHRQVYSSLTGSKGARYVVQLALLGGSYKDVTTIVYCFPFEW